jgi:signal transduction histidine kinase
MTALNHAQTLSPSKSPLRWLALLIWVLVAALHPTLLGLDLVRDYPQILIECQGALGQFGDCHQLAVSAAEVAVLSSWGLTLPHYALYMLALIVLSQLIYLTLSFLMLWQQGMSRLGLTVSLALIVIPFGMYTSGDEFGSIHPNLFMPGVVAGQLSSPIMLTFLYLMPNGRFSPRWAYIPWLGTTLLPFPLDSFKALGFPLPNWASSFANTVALGALLLGITFQIYRYVKETNRAVRQQTKWVIFGVVILASTILLWVPVFGGALSIPSGSARLLANVSVWTLIFLGQYFLPIAITIAILRYKLWNIDVIINRTLVYGGLTLMVVLLYTLIVVGSSRLFQNLGGLPGSLAATGVIAILFQPARERLQRSVNRLMFGQRDDPYAVLSHLSQQLQTTAVPAETLTSIVQTIAATLKLPYVAIELVEQEAQVGQATVGVPLGETLELPLRYQNEQVGRLRVSPRSSGEHFTPQELQLLADIAAQTGPVASATRLTLALLRSREQLVLAREEERRRIRRDLHDGLGPTLASQTLQLDTVLEMLNGSSEPAVEQLKALKGQTQQMVADIRRLVYELRPPALDELGLLEALRAHVAQLSGTSNSLRVTIDATPEPLPALPAAIEVAAYRITLEAVTNVIRHAQAHTCRVRLEITEDQQPAMQPSRLVVSVTDDGVGLPATLQSGGGSGVGLISMRERAAELGGTCVVGANPNGGTRASAVLPFTATAQSRSAPSRQGAT